MKRTLVLGTSTAIALALGGCVPSCNNESIEAVYGPPPMEEGSDSQNQSSDSQDLDLDPQDSDTDDQIIEALYGVPIDDPAYDEPIPDVYGPPVDFIDSDPDKGE